MTFFLLIKFTPMIAECVETRRVMETNNQVLLSWLLIFQNGLQLRLTKLPWIKKMELSARWT